MAASISNNRLSGWNFTGLPIHVVLNLILSFTRILEIAEVNLFSFIQADELNTEWCTSF